MPTRNKEELDRLYLIHPNATRDEAWCCHCARMFPVSEMTDEHLIPQGVFPENARHDLPRFTACREDNAKWSKTNETFRDALIKYITSTSRLRVLDELREAVRRAEADRAKQGKLIATARTERMMVLDDRGEPVPLDVAQVDLRALVLQAGCIIAALYNVQTGKWLDPSAQGLADVLHHHPNDIELGARILGAAPLERRAYFADRHFAYTWLVDSADDRRSEWVFSFYGLAYFWGMTYPAGEAPRKSILLDREIPGTIRVVEGEWLKQQRKPAPR